MLRLSLAWRISLVLILAVIALQILSSVAFFVRRDAATEAGFRAPLPDQVASLATLLDGASAEQQRLVLRALNGPSFDASVSEAPVPMAEAGSRIGWLEAAIRRNLAPGDGREVVARRSGPALEGQPVRRGLRRLFMRDPIEIIVGLAGRRSLVLRPADSLNIRLFGFPSGFVASLVGFAVAILAGLAILRETRPITRLAAAVERFGQGMQAEALPETGSPETRSLVRAFNAMQSRIAGLVQGRTFVVAAIAHDLRTHLTRLRLRVAMLPDDAMRDRAERDVEDMQALVEEALAYAKSTRSAAARAPVDLVALVDDIARSRIEAGAPVVFTPPAEPIQVLASRLALGRALGNLIDNAVAYGGSAELSIEAGRDEIGIFVEDRGPGIPEADRERILEPFERLEASRGRDTGGAGLGLAIVREIVDAHGGRLAITARPGGGSRFGIVLPA
ncbi:signal transduction histidine kinase [Kaistia hirudinis]|uniref:histidine kinase n=2 Tax=Kaistia hirudinis TaxID=1293440 RepID=A0A840ARN3_9HYPH|nr:ATP-binding protein [Kaistia hirudinis]MBB3931501.1 signal transduction histidine kinase [Kaistia hirudinis]